MGESTPLREDDFTKREIKFFQKLVWGWAEGEWEMFLENISAIQL